MNYEKFLTQLASHQYPWCGFRWGRIRLGASEEQAAICPIEAIGGNLRLRGAGLGLPNDLVDWIVCAADNVSVPEVPVPGEKSVRELIADIRADLIGVLGIRTVGHVK